MIEFFMNHPLLILAVAVVVIMVILFFPTKKSKKKVKAKSSETAKKEETKKEEPKVSEVEKTTSSEDSEESDNKQKDVVFKKKRLKKSKQKPEVVQVYKKTTKEQTQEKTETNSDEIEKNLQERADFVNTSKKISKFAGLKDLESMHENDCTENSPEEEVLDGYDKNCEVCKEIACHFDHSKRLSKFIKEGSFDDMFASHISDHYLNIDSGRHLKLEDIDKQLYDRTLSTLSNSETRVLVDGDGKSAERMKNDKDFMKSWLEEKRREEYAKMITSQDESKVDNGEYEDREDLKLSAKNLMIAGAIISRKKKISKR